MYIPGWFLLFVLASLSFHFFIHVPWSRCCNCFVKSHVKHQQFLQHLSLLKSYFLQLWQWEWMELRKNHDLCTAFLFWNRLKKSKCWFFFSLFWKLFPTSASTHFYDLKASSLLIQTDIVRTLCFKSLHRQWITPRIGVSFCKSDSVKHHPTLDKHRHQAKNVSVPSYRKNSGLLHLSNPGTCLFSLPWTLLLIYSTWQDSLTAHCLFKRSWSSFNEYT